MNKVITIGREFGSGGRELALKLSEALGYEYYDREIIEEISKRTELSEKYVQQVVEHDPHTHFPITVGHTFAYIHHYGIERQQAVYREQCEVIKQMAETSNCIIVGRCADQILKDYKPLKLFVYSDIDHKVSRCKERADVCEHYTDKQLKKHIKEVDKNRARYYRFYTGKEWGDKLNYDICINMATTDIDKVVAMLVKMLKD
jgi:cytidylate kinase